jgi:hypothetical protein
MNRSKLAFIYLPIIALFPLVIGCYQILHFTNWILDLGIEFYGFILTLTYYAPYTLLFLFVISLYERFYVYYRIVILSTLFVMLSCHFSDSFSSISIYNISNIIAILLIFAGIIGCVIHFSIQIKDFVRYVRTKR